MATPSVSASGESATDYWWRIRLKSPPRRLAREDHAVVTLCRSVLLILLPGLLVSPAGWAADLFMSSGELPEVLTVTRLKQSPAAVPGCVTVLDRALIQASVAHDIPELMRLVPGMMVAYSGYAKGNLATVNYHGSRAT